MNPLAIVECIVQAAVGMAPTVHLAEVRLRQRFGALGVDHRLVPVPMVVAKSALR